MENLVRTQYLLRDNAAARLARERILKLDPGYADNVTILYAAWSGEMADKDAAISRLAEVLRNQPTTFPWYYNVHVMAHSLVIFPLQGDKRFEAILDDPASNAPKF